MSHFLTRSGWLAPLATAAMFAVAIVAPSACARAVDGGALSGGDDDGESEKEFEKGEGGAGGADGYHGQASNGAGGAPATGPGSGGDPASSVAASSIAASSVASSVAASSVAAVSSVAASSSSGGGPGPCCVEDIFPGCFDDFLIEFCVCSIDDYCCAVEWDLQCVDEVEAFGCGTCN